MAKRKFGGKTANFGIPAHLHTYTEHNYDPFPHVELSESAVKEVAAEAILEKNLGFDLEFSPVTGKPHILGVASKTKAAACSWDHFLAKTIFDDAVTNKASLVGYSVMDADKPVLEGQFDIVTDPAIWTDSMIEFYLLNQDYCAAPAKEEDADDAGALGLMNLWTMASQYTNLPQWKRCREEGCFGPCPEHNEPWYCAIDAWAGLEGHYVMAERLRVNGVSSEFIEDLKKLTIYCGKMQRQGIAVNRELINVLETQIQEKRAGLFPNEMRLRTERCTKETKHWLTPFNPNSPKDIEGYFVEHGIQLAASGAATDKTAIRKTLERNLKSLGVGYETDKKSGVLTIVDQNAVLPQPIEYLYRLDQYKRAGKGLKSWFDDKYIGKDGFIHPRFVVTGTSTGRLSSSGPNFQNIPKVGFGSMVRSAIVPRDKNLKLIKSDKRQLELRICLYYSGITEDLGDDAFTWLVMNADGKFDAPAARLGYKPRDIAKSVSHAADYLEGLTILTEKELGTKRRQSERAVGALLVFDGKDGRPLWSYGGGIVCFTGGNLAERLFGDRSFEHRRMALEIQEIYFDRFPAVRRWHMALSSTIERTGRVKSLTGRCIELYGSAEDNLKLAAAFLGQGGGADEVQEHMLQAAELNRIALIQVHDELVFEIPKDWSADQCHKYISFFTEPSKRFGGIRFPIETLVGNNWGKYDENLNPEGCRVIG